MIIFVIIHFVKDVESHSCFPLITGSETRWRRPASPSRVPLTRSVRWCWVMRGLPLSWQMTCWSSVRHKSRLTLRYSFPLHQNKRKLCPLFGDNLLNLPLLDRSVRDWIFLPRRAERQSQNPCSDFSRAHRWRHWPLCRRLHSDGQKAWSYFLKEMTTWRTNQTGAPSDMVACYLWPMRIMAMISLWQLCVLFRLGLAAWDWNKVKERLPLNLLTLGFFTRVF